MVRLDVISCGRGKAIIVFLDTSVVGPNRYRVGVFEDDTQLVGYTDLISREAAYELADFESLIPGRGGDGSWRAVLARLTNKVEPPGVWEGSNAQYASQFRPGTPEWLDALITHRAFTQAAQVGGAA